MRNKYLIERKAENDAAYAIIGIVDADSMRDAMMKGRAFFKSETDSARVSLLSVIHTFTLDNVRW